MRKPRIAAPVVLALGLALTTLTPANAAQPAQPREQQGGAAPKAAGRDFAKLDIEGINRAQARKCDKAMKKLKEHKRQRAASAKATALCVKVQRPTEASKAAAKQLMAGTNAAENCVSGAGWVFTRFSACLSINLIITIYSWNKTTGTRDYEGRVHANVLNDITLAEDKAEIAQIQLFDTYDLEDDTAGAFVVGGFSCNGWCTNGDLDYPRQEINRTDVAQGSRKFGTTATELGMVGGVTTTVSLIISKPDAMIPSAIRIESPQMRCDNADRVPIEEPEAGIAATHPGCVVSSARPVLVYDETTHPKIKDVAEHVLDAQTTLPSKWGVRGPAGTTPIGKPLSYTSNRQVRRDNRTTACSGVPPSCDEFPMASTWQGASQVPSSDWSARTVLAESNHAQGGITGGFYRKYRILNHDEFWLWANPNSGGSSW